MLRTVFKANTIPLKPQGFHIAVALGNPITLCAAKTITA